MTPFDKAMTDWFSHAWPGPLLRQSAWMFAMGETLHFVGLCLLLGALIFIDLRLLGFFKQLPGKSVLALVPYAVVGFLINLSTGWAFFTSLPAMYWGNWAFWLKMSLILLAGINMLVFTIVEHRHVAKLGPGEDTSQMTKVTAVLSLGFWLLVLLLGRLLPVFTVSQN